MKKFIILLAALLLAGCASVQQSEFWKHDSVYKNWSHLNFSLFTYDKCNLKNANLSQQEQWWGIPVGCPEKTQTETSK